MSGLPQVPTIVRPERVLPPFQEVRVRAPAQPAGPPPLNAGDRLTRAEFERRFDAHPEIKKAELIEGVVYMPSPTRFDRHSRPHRYIATWLGVYEAATRGVVGGDNPTVRLDFENEVQPDALLRLDSALGGRSQITADDYLAGPPELVVEVAASSVAYDLHDKRRVYQRTGVQEYLALTVYEQEAAWFALREGVYEPLPADESGTLRSEVFPGLWLNVPAFWAGDLAAVLATLQEGLASAEHHAFVTKLQTGSK
jgi:Uma2 family endonuclease